MTIKTWLETTMQDADRRNHAALRPMLEALARSTSALRSADGTSTLLVNPSARPPLYRNALMASLMFYRNALMTFLPVYRPP